MIAPDGDGGLWRLLDPRLRLLAAILFAVVVVTLHDLGLLAIALVLALAIVAAGRASLRTTVRRVAAVDGFIAILLLTLPFTVPGESAFSIGPLTASTDGLRQAAAIAMKANAIMLAVLALVGTMDAAAIGGGLSALGAPPALVHILLFTMRYVDVLGRESRRLRRAMKARAFRARSNVHTWRSLGYLVGMILVRSLERSERIVAAMKCRGFGGRWQMGEAPALRGGDALCALGFAAVQAALLWLQYG